MENIKEIENVKLNTNVVIFWTSYERREDFTDALIKKLKEKHIIIKYKVDLKDLEKQLEDNIWNKEKFKETARKIIETILLNLSCIQKSWTIYPFSIFNLYLYSLYYLWEKDDLTIQLNTDIYSSIVWNIDKIIILNDKTFELNDLVLKIQTEFQQKVKDNDVLIKFIYKKKIKCKNL